MSRATEIERYGAVREPQNQRHAYRCAVCHSWAFHDAALQTADRLSSALGRASPKLPCPYCGADDGLRLIGKVEGPRITSERYEVPCDERCTGAKGNKCSCPCLGTNHGKDALIVVTRDEGGMSVAMANAKRALRDRPRIMAEVAEYTAERDALWAQLNDLFPELDQYRRRESVRSWGRFRLAQGISFSISRAGSMHSHKGRMGALAKARKAVEYEAKQAALHR